MKINQPAFIQNLIEEKNLHNYSSTNIRMKARSFIDIQEKNGYKKANLIIYQQFVSKLMCFLCDTKPNIIVAIKLFSKHNFNYRIDHFKTNI